MLILHNVLYHTIVLWYISICLLLSKKWGPSPIRRGKSSLSLAGFYRGHILLYQGSLGLERDFLAEFEHLELFEHLKLLSIEIPQCGISSEILQSRMSVLSTTQRRTFAHLDFKSLIPNTIPRLSKNQIKY